MSLIDIVYCYITETIPFTGDFEKLQKSFTANGFKEQQVDDKTWKYTRGAGIALEFNYNSEAIQMQVFLKRINEKTLTIKVGNWGFPFEPLLMKKRFKKNLDRIVKEISSNGILTINKDEVQNINSDAKTKKSLAILLIIAVVVSVIVSKIIKYLL